MNKKIPLIGVPLLLIIALGTSLVAYAFNTTKMEKRTFFFPNAISGELISSARYIPSGKDRQQKIQQYTEELLLGPHEFGSASVIEAEVKLKSLLFRENILYIDFNREFVFREASIEHRLGLIKKNIQFNFPYIKDVIITVDGRLPFGGRTMETE